MPPRLGRLKQDSCIFFVCDIQERFRSAIHKFPAVVQGCSRMVKAASVMQIATVVTEQYPKGLGHTVEELQAEVRRLADEGIAMLVTDHNVQQTLRICDRAYIIHQGQNLKEGDPRSIINDPEVRNAYLASTFRGDEFD